MLDDLRRATSIGRHWKPFQLGKPSLSWQAPHPFSQTNECVFAVAEVVVDLGIWVELDIATIYGIPLVLAAFTRNRRLLWGLMAALTLATFITYALQIPVGAFELREALFVNRVLDAVALLLTAGLLHMWMVSLDIREAQAHFLQEQNRKLDVANDLLIARESQIVRQNEELIRRRLEAEDASGPRHPSSTPSRMTYAIR